MRARLGDNWERISRMSIIEEGYGGEKCALCALSPALTSHLAYQPLYLVAECAPFLEYGLSVRVQAGYASMQR